MPRIAIIGGGPAGLMAAEVIAAASENCPAGTVDRLEVLVFDAMPSLGRKFLMAGKGGMNITHAEPLPAFISRYGERHGEVGAWLARFGPAALRDWIHGLGIQTFVGTSDRVFPTEMKAAPLLRAWLHRLRELGVQFHVRHRWLGWTADRKLRFATPAGELECTADAVVLALGGGSWAKLGSDGAWVPLLCERDVAVSPLKPANCGFDVAWSSHFSERFAGHPVKPVVASVAGLSRQGEFNITAGGIEGGLVYALSAPLRDTLERDGKAALTLDLAPGRTLQRLTADLARPRGRDSLANHLRRRVGLDGVKAGLLRELCPPEALTDTASLAAAIKALPLPVQASRPIDEAISSAGGIDFAGLDARLMLRGLPGVFAAGEMLDWEAPTGGYLLTACFASGRVAGEGVLAWLASSDPQDFFR
ncbi:TIGR03862 family flavoprotein [Quatrionicoccus australiensis]|uniref:TIGR03862 family flavoprotein n=1 Tax=Quatrionicoccus australiensis TaxID=138118 RepID=UPI001CFA3F5E|nr:TIGR03862 family flavoprotein [Quatrionicoccus australiensis]MCB4361283.1 TIGR03862 family flavoprotein [Quatrionicoccus australiensis]